MTMDDEKIIYVLHCNKCNFKRFSNGNDIEDMLPLNLSDIPRNIPKLDIIKKKTIKFPDKKRTKVFRCPKCGFTVKAFKYNKPEEIQEEDDE
jgi:hypothetical protein